MNEFLLKKNKNKINYATIQFGVWKTESNSPGPAESQYVMMLKNAQTKGVMKMKTGVQGHEGGRGVGEASWSHDTHPNSGLAVQAGGSLRGYGGMSDMDKAGLVTR